MWELRLGASNSQGALSYIWEDQQMTTSRKLSLAEKFKMDNLRILDADYAKKEEIIKKQMTILSDQKKQIVSNKKQLEVINKNSNKATLDLSAQKQELKAQSQQLDLERKKTMTLKKS